MAEHEDNKKKFEDAARKELEKKENEGTAFENIHQNYYHIDKTLLYYKKHCTLIRHPLHSHQFLPN